MKKAIYCITITALLFSSGVTLVVLKCVTDICKHGKVFNCEFFISAITKKDFWLFPN